MRNKAKIILGLAVAGLGCCVCAACAPKGFSYGNLSQQGHSVSIKYDPNGGRFASTNNVELVDVYPTEQVKKGVKLLEPGSEERGNADTVTLSTVSRSGYYLAGWYESRSLRVNAQGEALDEYGELCSVSGKAQGYTYADRWDFENDIYKNENPEFVEGNYTVTFYAAWVPHCQYEFYFEGENGWEQYGSFAFDPIGNTKDFSLALPAFPEEGGAMAYGRVPKRENYTFENAYLDENKQTACQTITHAWADERETGTASNLIQKVYVTWEEGTWINVKKPEQLKENALLNYNFNILADLDFDGGEMSRAFASGEFTGKIYGNGHKISNVTTYQLMSDDGLDGAFGTFGTIGATAEIKDITFENIEYIVAFGSRHTGTKFGAFAGSINENAKLENVTVTGKLLFEDVNLDKDCFFGLMSADPYNREGITYQITCDYAQTDWTQKDKFTFTVENGKVTVSAKTE